MRAYIVLLAATVFVVAVSAGENETEDDGKSMKNELAFFNKLFDKDPIRKHIAQLVNEWDKTVPGARSKFRAELAEYCKALQKKTA
uniref:8 kDa glycoprotein n=2 Tax=Taeniidae TaxID=6208 RepID=B6E491_ECHGR|nr:8 kDa glycoprotein [Taenia multiceps]ACI42342.1 8 kDa glycoprotein [Echinococcus granulosus]